MADVVPDVAAVLDQLGAQRFYTLGWAGGGPHALTCAALLPDRLIGAATVGGIAPYNADRYVHHRICRRCAVPMLLITHDDHVDRSAITGGAAA